MELYGDKDQEEALNHLQKWFEDNKKLPNKIDRIFLTRFYYYVQKDIEEAKKLIELNYEMRISNPYLFINRDPTDQDTHNTYSYTYMMPLAGLTPDNCRVALISFKDPDPKLMHFAEDAKTLLMIVDCRFSMPDVIKDNIPYISTGDILLVDMAGVSMQHIKAISIRTLRIFLKFLHNAYSERVAGLHLINCPTYLNKILAFIRPFISKEIFEMMHFHSNGIESLYEYVPKEMLPEEYGGFAGKIEELSEEFRQSLVKKREYLMDPDYWRVVKS